MLTYYPEVFLRESAAAAREIILTDEAGLTSTDRWTQETDYLRPFMSSLTDGPVLDYGCGIGRLSKVLVEQGHPVFGVDISSTMRQQAVGYVNNDTAFTALSPEAMLQLTAMGARFHAAIAIWVLQHIPAPLLRLDLLRASLERDATLLVVNRHNRAIPVCNDQGEMIGWADDGLDLDDAMLRYFVLEHSEDMPAHLCEPGAYLRLYRRAN